MVIKSAETSINMALSSKSMQLGRNSHKIVESSCAIKSFPYNTPH